MDIQDHINAMRAAASTVEDLFFDSASLASLFAENLIGSDQALEQLKDLGARINEARQVRAAAVQAYRSWQSSMDAEADREPTLYDLDAESEQ